MFNTYELITMIALGVVILLYLIISVVLGRKISLKEITNIKEFILSILPQVINGVEDNMEGSSSKKETAITLTMSYVQDKFGTLSDKDLKTLISFTGKHIEEILSTPTKKDC